MKKSLMFLLIFILIFLLLLPPGLRLFGENLYTEQKISKKDDEVYVLNCTGLNETINQSYVSDKPYNFQYLIKGNYVDLDDDSDLMLNYIIVDVKNYAEISYNEIDDITEYRIAFNKMDNIPELLWNYSMSYNEQNSFYTQNGFNCTKISY